MTPQGAFYSGAQEAYQFPFSRSDTVFKAILNAWELLWGGTEVERLLGDYLQVQKAQDIPFSISSIYPVVGDVYFLPCPFSLGKKADNNLPREMLEHILWISARVYQEWLEGHEVSFSADCFIQPGLYCHPAENHSITEACPERILWSEDQRTRNKVEPITSKTSTFQANQIYYAEPVEHYLLAEVREDYEKKLEAVFRLLAHEGIGGKRSVGCGGYTYHPPLSLPDCLEFVNREVEGSFTSLSLYWPCPEDIQKGLLNQAQFQWIERQGWHSDSHGLPLRQPRLRLFKEGSHFHAGEISMKVLLKMESNSSAAHYHYVYPFRVVAPGVKA